MAPGSRQDILARMLARLPVQEVPAGPDGASVAPLAALTTRDRDDPAIAVLDAWACVLDVVSFYLDRIAEEGYLSTAREDRSVLELARTVGYEPLPGLAAGTPLAFTVLTQPGMPETVPIPAGTKVQAIPGQDQQPRVFETVEAVDGRPEWNTLRAKPAAMPVPASATGLALAAPAGLRAGEAILVLAGDGSPAQRYVPRVAGPAGDRSISLQAPLSASPAGLAQGFAPAMITSPVAFTLPRHLRLFGHDAPPIPADRRPRAGGVYRYDLGAGTWAPRHDGLPSVAMLALAATRRSGRDLLFAVAEGHGMFRSADLGVSWQPVETWQATRTVRALCTDADGALYAGGDDGTVFRSRDDGATWQQLGALTATGSRLPLAPVYALFASGGTIYAGTDDGVFASTDGGVIWSLLAAIPAVRSIAIANNVLVCVTTAPDRVGLIDLPVTEPLRFLPPDRLAGQILRAVTSFPADAPTNTAFLTDDALLLAGLRERVELPTPGGPTPGGLALVADGHRGLMVALAPGAFLDDGNWPSLAASDGQDWVDLDRIVGDVTAGRWLVLAGVDGTGAWPVIGSSTVVRSDFGVATSVTRVYLGAGRPLDGFLGPEVRTTEVLLSGEPLPLATTPVTGAQIVLDHAIPPLPPGRRLVAADGTAGTGESVTVAAMTDERTIALAEPLRSNYEVTSFTLNANVAMATHGETAQVEAEVLGSGDGSAGQRFLLARSPLTYVPAATDTGARSTLVVSVDGVPWQEVATLNDSKEADEVYLARRDSEGRTEVVFGDGVHGARPRIGDGNISAVYRHGLGPEGNVVKQSLVLMQTRPLGVQEVTNPLPATGGVADEAGGPVRTRLRQRVLAMDRLVALADFEHVATAFAGIAAAQATALSAGGTGLLHLTVAGVGGQPVPAGSGLYNSLAEAIDRRRPLGRPVRIDSYRPLRFAVTARLRTDRRHDQAAVRSAAEEAIRATFAVGVRDFGQPVRRGELIALLQGVAGVVAVDLDGLGLEGDEMMPRRVLSCDRARWADGAVLPAELLVAGTISFSLETAG